MDGTGSSSAESDNVQINIYKYKYIYMHVTLVGFFFFILDFFFFWIFFCWSGKKFSRFGNPAPCPFRHLRVLHLLPINVCGAEAIFIIHLSVSNKPRFNQRCRLWFISSIQHTLNLENNENKMRIGHICKRNSIQVWCKLDQHSIGFILKRVTGERTCAIPSTIENVGDKHTVARLLSSMSSLPDERKTRRFFRPATPPITAKILCTARYDIDSTWQLSAGKGQVTV